MSVIINLAASLQGLGCLDYLLCVVAEVNLFPMLRTQAKNMGSDARVGMKGYYCTSFAEVCFSAFI